MSLTPLLIAAAVVPFIYIALPVYHLLGNVDTASIRHLVQDSTFWQALGTSLCAALLTTVCAVVFGLPTAFVLSRYRVPGARWLEALLLIPIVMPPIVGGIAELGVYGPRTALGGWFAGHGVFLTDSLLGVVLAESFVTAPFLVFAAKAGFIEAPAAVLEAAQLDGADLWTQFSRVSVPLALPAIGIGALLTFARAFGEFGATLMMAYHPYTVPVDLWVAFSGGGLQDILQMAALIVLFTMLAAVVVSVVMRASPRR